MRCKSNNSQCIFDIILTVISGPRASGDWPKPTCSQKIRRNLAWSVGSPQALDSVSLTSQLVHQFLVILLNVLTPVWRMQQQFDAMVWNTWNNIPKLQNFLASWAEARWVGESSCRQKIPHDAIHMVSENKTISSLRTWETGKETGSQISILYPCSLATFLEKSKSQRVKCPNFVEAMGVSNVMTVR